nr:hypothetical protein BaRGS_005387 [Batillaria attramentaria]
MIDENADNDEVGSDSDDAPEDVGFTSSRETEKKRMQSILQQIRKGRDELKEKRRKKDELFKLQKRYELLSCEIKR